MLNIQTNEDKNELYREYINSLVQVSNEKLTFEERLFIENCNDVLYMFGSNSLNMSQIKELRQIYVKYAN